jgi:heme exporter protein D
MSWAVTVRESAMNVLPAVVSAMLNTEERVSRKEQLLAEVARQYGRLKYCHQAKIHQRNSEEK